MISHVQWLGLTLTDFCNMECKYCFISAKNSGSTLPFGQAREFLRFFSAYAVPRAKIHVTGGEPTMHPRLPEIVDAVNENFIDPLVLVVTNGLVPGKLLRTLLKKGAVVHVTFEGLPGIQDFERPLPDSRGSSQQVLKTIKTVIKEDPGKLVLRLNYSKKKFGREEEIAGFLSSLGVKRVSVGVLYPLGRARDYAYSCMIDSSKGLSVMEKALLDRGLDLSDSKTALNKSPFLPSCAGGLGSFFLTVDGKIVTCQNIPNASKLRGDQKIFVVGDVESGALLDERRLKRFRDFASAVSEDCASCSVKDYCGRCPLEKKIVSGKPVFNREYCDHEHARIKSHLCG